MFVYIYRIEPVNPNTKHVATCDEMQEIMARGQVVFALNQLWLESGIQRSQIRIQKKPCFRLFSNEEADGDEIWLVPMTTRVSKAHAAGLHVKAGGKTMTLLKMSDDLNAISEFWFVRPVTDAKEANMRLKDKHVKVQIPTTSDKAPTINVTIPVAVNTKHIEAGCELVLFKPEHSSIARETKGISACIPDVQIMSSSASEPPAKKRKNGK